jgi:hypothetical protein
VGAADRDEGLTAADSAGASEGIQGREGDCASGSVSLSLVA